MIDTTDMTLKHDRYDQRIRPKWRWNMTDIVLKGCQTFRALTYFYWEYVRRKLPMFFGSFSPFVFFFLRLSLRLDIVSIHLSPLHVSLSFFVCISYPLYLYIFMALYLYFVITLYFIIYPSVSLVNSLSLLPLCSRSTCNVL